MSKNYYQWLGVTEQATTREIQQAYRTAAKQVHPDKLSSSSSSSTSVNTMEQLNEAYHVLSDDLLRKEYDAERCMTDIKLPPIILPRVPRTPLFPTTVTLSMDQWWSGCTVQPTRMFYQPCTACCSISSSSSSSSCTVCHGQTETLEVCNDTITLAPRCKLSTQVIPQVKFQVSPRTWHAWEYDATSEQISVIVNSWTCPVLTPDGTSWWQLPQPTKASAAVEGWYQCTEVPSCWIYYSTQVQCPWSDFYDWDLYSQSYPSFSPPLITVTPTFTSTPPNRLLTQSTNCPTQ